MIDWYYLIIASAILNGIAQVVEKRMLKVEHALAFSLTTTVGVSLLSLLLIPFASFTITSVDWLLVFAFSSTLALSYWLAARMFRHGNISVAAPMYNSLPILFVVIGAFLFLGEQLSITAYVAVITITIATYLMFSEIRRTKKSDKSAKRYNHLTLIATLITAVNAIILKYVIGTIDVYTFLIITSIVTSLFLSFEILGKSMSYRATALTAIRGNVKSLVLMSFLTTSYRLLFYFAILTAPISLATPVNSAIVVVLTVLASAFLFKEKRIKQKALLSIVLLVSIYLLVR